MAEITECMTCGSMRLQVVLDLGCQPLAENWSDGGAYPLAVQQCKECGLHQLTYEVPREVTFPPDHPYATGNTQAMRQHFADLADQIPLLMPRTGLLVDIGASDGTFLAEVALRAPGIRCLAVEPTASGADRTRARGIEAIEAPFTRKLAQDIYREHGPASIVTACNVLAHVGSQHDFLSGVAYLTGETGTFITENHDWLSVSHGLQIDTVYHEHLRYYTRASLGYALSMHGFLVSDSSYIPTHGGSFRTWAVQEKRDLAGRVQAARAELRQLMERAAQAGPVYGIGAATRATPLIHWAGLEDYLDMVLEVPGSAKLGTVIPGTAIPVTDEDLLIEDQPPYALLLSWHIAATVVPKLRAMGYRGTFIKPLPHPEFYRER